MKFKSWLAAVLSAAMLMAGCASPPPPPPPPAPVVVKPPATRVILLPEADGKPSAVEVVTASGRQLVAQPYQTAEVSQEGQLQSGLTTAAEVTQKYGGLLAAKPPEPKRFTLYFNAGTSSLTPQSEMQVAEILAEAARRAGGEIIVIGHTDRVGTVESNDALALQRANSVRQFFVQRGFKPELVEAIGRGEREPLVPTPDEVAEPRNRRAEILVR